MTIKHLSEHLNKFVNGSDISIQWAKEAETLLDQIEDSEGSKELENILDNLQEKLSLYRPGGGDYLIDESEMKSFCKSTISMLSETSKNKNNEH